MVWGLGVESCIQVASKYRLCACTQTFPRSQHHPLRSGGDTTVWGAGSGPGGEISEMRAPHPLSWAHAGCHSCSKGLQRASMVVEGTPACSPGAGRGTPTKREAQLIQGAFMGVLSQLSFTAFIPLSQNQLVGATRAARMPGHLGAPPPCPWLCLKVLRHLKNYKNIPLMAKS